MKLYRICTEAKNVAAIERLVGSYVDGFSIWRGTGYWKGTKEKSLMIELWGNEPYLESVARQIALQIKVCNAQEAVLVQVIEAEGEFV